MAYSYLQAFMQFPNAKNGSLKVFIANSTDEAVLYDPVNSNPISQPISIDSDGYAASFWCETDAFYDVEISNYIGSVVETRNNVAVIGTSAGLPGPQGEQGIQGPKGDSIVGPVGPAGTDGTDGVDGVDGTDGVSLLSIRVDETSDTGKVTYTLSSDPSNWIDAGSVMPGGIGQVRVTPGDTLGYLVDKVTVAADDGLEILDNVNKLEFRNTKPETFKSQVHQYSSVQNFLSSLFVAGTGIDIEPTPDLNQLKINATGSAVGGFLWKGTWDNGTAYNLNNAVWYFDETISPPINRLYIATAANLGINPYEDTLGTAWSVMLIIDALGDEFVRLDSADTVSGYLADKLLAGTGITLTRNDALGEAWFVISATSNDVGYTVYAQESVLKGYPLYITNGSQPDQLFVAKASTNGNMPANLIAAEDIAGGSTGRAVSIGLETGLNTIGYTTGQPLYVGVAGGYTAIKPYEKAQIIGTIARVDAGDGSIFFNVDLTYSDKITTAGVIGDAPTWISEGNIVTMGSCRCRVYDNQDYKGFPQAYTIAGASITIPADGDSMVVVSYNSGNPRYILADAWNFFGYNLSNDIPVARFWYQSGTLHSLSLGSTGNGLIEKLTLRQSQTEYYSRVANQGLALSDAGSRNVSLTAAYVWAGTQVVPVAPFTSASNSLYQMVRSANVWTKSVVTQWNNTQINANAGLVSMNNNKWSCVWIYKSIGDAIEAFAVQHNLEYNTQSEASAASPRSDIPYVLQSHCLLVGRIVFQKSAATGTITSAFVTAFGTASVTDHGSLSGLQGTGPEYQHVNATERTQIGYLLTVTSDVQTQINGKAPTAHNSAGTSFGVGSASEYGHVKVDATPTDGSNNAVSSNAVFDALANKAGNRLSIGAYSTVDTWLNGGIYHSLPKSNQFQERTTHLRVFCGGGTIQTNQYISDIFVAIKVQSGVLSYTVTQFDGSNSYGKIASRLDQDANWWFITVAAFVPAYCTITVFVMDGDVPSSFSNNLTTSTTGLTPALMNNLLFKTSDGTYGLAETIGSKGSYAGISVPGANRINLMSNTSSSAFGIFNESSNKWLVVHDPGAAGYTGGVSTLYGPATESKSSELATTAWVRGRIGDTTLLATFGSSQSGLMVYTSGYIRVYTGVAITLSNSSAYEGQTLTFVGYNCSSGSFTVNGVACNFPQYALKFVFLDGAWHNLI